LNIVGGHLIPIVLTSSEEAERLGLEAALAAAVGLRVSFVFASFYGKGVPVF
jgi:hypothetical protein